MSATRDPSQKITFLFTPMSQIVKRVRESQQPASTPNRSRVLKSEDLRQAGTRPGLLREHRGPDFGNEAPARPVSRAPLAPVPSSEPAIAPLPAGLARELLAVDLRLKDQRGALDRLAQSLNELDELEKRLRFMMLELEDLLKD